MSKRKREGNETEEEDNHIDSETPSIVFPITVEVTMSDSPMESTDEEEMISDEEDVLDNIFRPLLFPMALRFLWARNDVMHGIEEEGARGNFTSLEYAMANRYLRAYLNTSARDASTGLLDTILGYYFRNGDMQFPSLDTLVEIIAERPCGCTLLYDRNILRSAYRHAISGTDWAFIPSCAEVDMMIEYNTLQNRWPSFDELVEFASRQLQFLTDPENFHQRDRVHVPAMNIENLPVIKGEAGHTCAVCHEEISVDQEALVLEPCKHRYHNVASDCLGGGSIRTWLGQHNFCPMCKSKVN